METKEKNRRPATERPKRSASQEVVYTQPAAFNKQKFVLRLLTVVAVVLALIFGLSIFFKVDEDKVLMSFKMQRGTEQVADVHNYTERQILEASGIKDGENLLTIRESEISSRIMEKLPYVVQVRVRIKVPDTVNIEIIETDVVYAAEASDGTWWLMRSDGKIVEKTNAADAKQNTVLLGIKLSQPKQGEQAVALEPEPIEPEEGEEQTPVTVLASEQLSTALSICKMMEQSGIIGTMASVDVTSLGSIELWYGSQYQIHLGDATRLDFKIGELKPVIDYLGSSGSGMLDASFTIKEKEVIYTPFE